MWWYRAFALGIVVLAVAGCGFEPLYGGGKQSPMRAEFAAVQVAPIADRVGQQLRNRLLDVINPDSRSALPEYRLEITLTESKSGLAVKKSEFATRANLTLKANFHLRDARSSRSLFSGTSSVVGSYNILDSAYATLIAERDARTRIVTQIAQDIHIRLAAYFRLRDPENPTVSTRP